MRTPNGSLIWRAAIPVWSAPRSDQLGNGDRAFIAAIASGDQSSIISDPRSGTQTLALTLAANQAMKSGEVVIVRRFV